MKTKVEDLLKTVSEAVDNLKADSGAKEFTPQLGSALGGLRTAKTGLRAHLEKALVIKVVK